ncbi:MAG: hypothetical protein WBA06_06615, partial [Candidatus Aquilonibacter sp.]
HPGVINLRAAVVFFTEFRIGGEQSPGVDKIGNPNDDLELMAATTPKERVPSRHNRFAAHGTTQHAE